jgi:glucoamylase
MTVTVRRQGAWTRPRTVAAAATVVGLVAALAWTAPAAHGSVASGEGTGVAGHASGARSLVASFDNVGITSPGATKAGDLDGTGDSFSSVALAADALRPGGTLLHDGVHLTWPDVAPGRADDVLADGQTIAVKGKGGTLGIVATAAYGPASGAWTVDYTDGTTTTATVTTPDWTDTAPAAPGDILATTGTADGGGAGPVSLFYATIPLDRSKTVDAVVLPTVGSAVGSGVTSLHVFDLAVGSPAPDAAGAPGTESYYDQGRKDCVGTAADTASKVWYTVADGTLSDVYGPTIDNTDVKSLDPIVTGPGFDALQPRDMTYRVVRLGGTGMACRVIGLDAARHVALVTDFVTDPTTESVVMQDSLVRLPGAEKDLHEYLRFNPLLDGHGGGGSQNAGGESATTVTTSRGRLPVSYSTNSYTEAVNRSYATPIYAALASNEPFAAVETGYAGAASDGLSELDASRRLDATRTDATDGNVVQTVELRLHPADARRTSSTGPAAAAGRHASSDHLGAYTGGSSNGDVVSCSTGQVVKAGHGHSTRDADGSGAPLPSSGADQVTSAGIAASVAATPGVTGPVTVSDVSTATVALGLGTGETGAVDHALSSSAGSFVSVFDRYQAQWHAYDAILCAGPRTLAGAGSALSRRAARSYWVSANVIKASEDKTFPGATSAGLGAPWGQSVPAGNAVNGLATYFGSYREVFPRDAYETFTGFLTDGDLPTARAMVHFLFGDMQLPDGAFPRNGLLNGKAAPDTGGLQLDETADPIVMAWQTGLAGDRGLYRAHIRPAADFLAANGPTDGVERWEEQTGFSPSTMADEVAGLVAAAAIAKVQGDTTSARLWLATADDYRRLILTTTVTDDGPLSSDPYFIRVDKTGDPDSASDYTVGNGDPTSFDQRSVIDQGFVELTRLGELSPANPADAPLLTNSLAVAAATIDAKTPSGTAVMRYNGDGYGDCVAGTPAGDTCTPTGAPWAPTDAGTGHPWPVLSGENGEYQILAGDHAAADADLSLMINAQSAGGLEPEQIWDSADLAASPYGSDPTTASIGFVDGKPDGSADPLTWAQSEDLRLIRDIGTGRLLEQPSVVADRYATTRPGTVALSVTAPLAVAGGDVPTDLTRPSTTVDAATTTVTGTTAAGATVEVAVTGTAPGAARPTIRITTVKASKTGAWSAKVRLAFGTNDIEVAALRDGTSDTNEAIFAVNDEHVTGTVVLDAAPAADGGAGPGTYAYPTATNGDGSAVFAPGSFRLGGLEVVDSGKTVSFQVGIANLESTFGSLDGAQLVDLYIHAPTGSVPAGEQQSTAAAGAWNYGLASDSAWNQLIEVDGFGTDDWVTPSSATGGLAGAASLGSPQVSVAQLPAGTDGQTPGLVTITVPTSVLGTPGPGWTFTVTLTGQDGSGGGTDNARVFTATPGGYTFGVCSAAVAAEADPPAVCALPPASVPIVLDTIPPAGVDVQTELNPLDQPSGVTLQGVTVPSSGAVRSAGRYRVRRSPIDRPSDPPSLGLRLPSDHAFRLTGSSVRPGLPRDRAFRVTGPSARPGPSVRPGLPCDQVLRATGSSV